MDGVILVSVLILAVIFITEVVCLLSDSACKRKNLYYTLIIPLFENDVKLKERLYEISELLNSDADYISEKILVVNFSASDEQLELAKSFCLHNNIQEIIHYDSLEKKLSEMFAIDIKK